MDKELQKTTTTTPSAPAPAKENIGSQDSATGNKGKSRSRRTLQEREEAYKKRRAALNKAGARLKEEARKERNGQLIAWGIFIEAYYKCCGLNERNEFREAFKVYLKGRELDRALAGCDRLDHDFPVNPDPKPLDVNTETKKGVAGTIKDVINKIIN